MGERVDVGVLSSPPGTLKLLLTNKRILATAVVVVVTDPTTAQTIQDVEVVFARRFLQQVQILIDQLGPGQQVSVLSYGVGARQPILEAGPGIPRQGAGFGLWKAKNNPVPLIILGGVIVITLVSVVSAAAAAGTVGSGGITAGLTALGAGAAVGAATKI